MMTKLREMTFAILWVLVISFVGLMVFQWGADITGRKGRTNILGKIEGQKVTIQEFEKAIEQAREMEQNKTGKSPDFERSKQIRDEVWESFVQRVLLGKEIDKYDIQVTNREVALFILNNPLPELQKNPQFQTDGKFDMQKYRQAVLDPQNAQAWLGVERYIQQSLPFQKLQTLITSSAIVTEEEIRYEFMQKSMQAKIEYLHVPISAFASIEVQVSDEEIRNYYEEHKDDFKIEERRKVNYVLFSTEPSSEDSSRVYELANDILKEAKSGEDFAKLADEYSEDPSVQNNHGDLGYFDRASMVPEFSEAAFSAKPGEVVGPVKTRYGLHIIKVFDKKVEDGKEKVKASHILISFAASGKTIDNATTDAENFKEIVSEQGFQQAADRLTYEIHQTDEFPKKNYIPGLGVMPEAVEWVFENDVNEVSNTFRVSQGYVIFQISEIMPGGFRPLDEVKDICKSRIEAEKRKSMAKEYAETIKSNIEEAENLSEIAAQDTSNKVVYDTTAHFKYNISLPKIGRAPSIVAAAFSLPLNTLSKMLETQRGFYFIRVLDRTEFNEGEYAQQHDSIKTRLLNQKKQQIFNQWYAQLKEKADIVDNRRLFYRS